MVKIFKEANKLALMLGGAGLDGTISLAAISGLFRPENALLLSVMFIAGPGAILTAFLLEGTMKERIIASLLAGIIATIIVVLAASIGAKALSFVNVPIIKIAGGIAILAIGLLIMGLKIPENAPLAIMAIGIIAGILMR